MTYPYRLGDPIGTKATLGLIVLQSDETIEHDLRRLLPVEGVALYTSRVPSGLEVTGDTLASMAEHLPASAGLFPRSVSMDAVGYGCTSGTSVIGAGRVASLVQSGCTTRHVTEPVSGLIAACAALGVTRLGFLSPYVQEVSEHLRKTLNAAGIETPIFGSFDEGEEAKVARIAPESIAEAAIALAGQGGIDAVFLSCTNLRTLDVINQIESRIGLPVLSSNLVIGWHMARLAGVPITPGFGRLSALP